MKIRGKKPKMSIFTVGAKKPARVDGKQTNSSIRRSATEVMNYRVVKKVVLICVAIIVAILLLMYALALIYNRTGRFTVSIQNPDATFSITLSETKDFKTSTATLMNDQEVRMTNICGDNLPKNIDNIDGEHNGENYLAYTFYCKNVGATDCSLNYELTFNNVTNAIDECMRIRLYVDGKETNYAKTRADGGGPEDHYCDKSFAGNYLICYGIVSNVAIEQAVRFTIVVWVEGDDPECTDSRINGTIKFDMTIEAKPVPLEE